MGMGQEWIENRLEWVRNGLKIDWNGSGMD
jgi:hypothetical protein